MRIGKRFWNLRPRNDLDDYLAEVDSYLFCVSLADRKCLHRDLKGHVREMTTDASLLNQFKGRYAISQVQLREEIGKPKEIASKYMESVKKKPSVGMRGFLIISAVIFLFGISIGFDRIVQGIQIQWNLSLWFIVSGLALVVLGAIASFIIVKVGSNFDRYYSYSPYIAGLIIFFAPFVAQEITALLIQGISISYFAEFQTQYYPLFLFDIFIFIIIGLFISLQHYRVYNHGNRNYAVI
jgi:hypothetical protein